MGLHWWIQFIENIVLISIVLLVIPGPRRLIWKSMIWFRNLGKKNNNDKGDD